MRRIFIVAVALIAAFGITTRGEVMATDDAGSPRDQVSLEQATIGGGCFWCMEAIFEELDGVKKVVSGFAGDNDQVSYKEVCSGRTDHAEVIQVTFDPRVISYRQILGVFFASHDPTTLNRQGADVGTQYRSVVFTSNKAQQVAAQEAIAKLEQDKVWKNPVVTSVEPLYRFFKADEHHQDYYRRNRTQGYCQVVINPKLAKFRKEFAGLLKD